MTKSMVEITYKCGHLEVTKEVQNIDRSKPIWMKIKSIFPKGMRKETSVHLCSKCFGVQLPEEREQAFNHQANTQRKAPPTKGVSETIAAVALAEDKTAVD